MTIKFLYSLDIKEDTAGTHAAALAGQSSCIIRLVVRFRYKLRFLTDQNDTVRIEDVETPALSTSLRIPLVFPLSLWQELYLADALKKSNLIDSSVRAALQRKIAGAVGKIAEEKGNRGGFAVVVKALIVKEEVMSTEERDRIGRIVVSEFVGRSGGAG